MLKRIVLLLAVVLLSCGPVIARRGPFLAQKGEEDLLARYWRSMDADGDGFGTKQELHAFFCKVFRHSVSDKQVRVPNSSLPRWSWRWHQFLFSAPICVRQCLICEYCCL